jgi:hypothetical protein
LASNPHPIPPFPAHIFEKHTFDHAFDDLDGMDSFFDKIKEFRDRLSLVVNALLHDFKTFVLLKKGDAS